MSFPQIPRQQWVRHPRFPAQTLLLGSHENFRRINAYLCEQAAEVPEPERLELLYRRWIGAMRSHEHYEEHKLYPYLARRWNAPFDEAEEGHRQLHDKHAGVLHAFSQLRVDAPNARDGLVQALAEHQSVLTEHLRHEEDLVIPLLLELTPEEFRAYYHG